MLAVGSPSYMDYSSLLKSGAVHVLKVHAAYEFLGYTYVLNRTFALGLVKFVLMPPCRCASVDDDLFGLVRCRLSNVRDVLGAGARSRPLHRLLRHGELWRRLARLLHDGRAGSPPPLLPLPNSFIY